MTEKTVWALPASWYHDPEIFARERELIEEDFERRVRQAIGKPTLALEFLRQLTLCSRSKS